MPSAVQPSPLGTHPAWRGLIIPGLERRSVQKLTLRMHASSSCETWLEAVARDQDREAFAQLFKYYAPKIKGMMLKKGADLATAEETAQEAMLRVWHRAGEFSSARGGASAWVFTIARNLFIDRVRREKRFDYDAEPQTVEDQIRRDTDLARGAEPGGEATLDARRARARVRTALANLPEEQAAVIGGSYWQGKSLGRIAQDSELPEGTVKTRARLAMARLRAALLEERTHA